MPKQKNIISAYSHGACTIKLYTDVPYFIEYSAHFFDIENDAEIFPAHYTWKVAEKGFKIAFVMNKLAMINSFKLSLDK
jgi:hypothetical protein